MTNVVDRSADPKSPHTPSPLTRQVTPHVFAGSADPTSWSCRDRSKSRLLRPDAIRPTGGPIHDTGPVVVRPRLDDVGFEWKLVGENREDQSPGNRSMPSNPPTPPTLRLMAIAMSLFPCFVAMGADETPTLPRLLVTTDIGGDPDDQQSLVRLMMYVNEFQIEGLVASAAGTPGELKEQITRPDLIRDIVGAYGKVRPRLMSRADGWPDAGDLLARIKTGNPQRGRAAVGQQHDTAGSRLIIDRVDAGSPRQPLNISIWGGQTDLAQALFRVRADRGTEGLARFVQKFRVYDIGDQDRIADWMMSEFPGMFYILSKAAEGEDKRHAAFRGMYLTGDESLTSLDWIKEHVLSSGPLGALYPTKTWTAPNPHGCLKEGDTPSWFFFLPLGGNDPSDPTVPGWGGRFRKTNDGWYRDETGDGDPRTTVSRWREVYQADFAKRMSWCRK